MMAQYDRRRLYSLVALYAFLAVGWAAFALWVVPPLLAAERPGRVAAALKHHFVLKDDTLRRMLPFSGKKERI